MVVVIDVLRASTTLVTALAHGAMEVIPCSTVEEARKINRSMGREDVLLCGERGGKKLTGFELGNSPLQYNAKVVQGKTIVFTSTNGTRMINLMEGGDSVFIGGFVNAKAIVDLIKDSSKDCLFACSGSDGGFSVEDAVCAGMMIEKIEEQVGEENLYKTDEAFASQILYQYHSSDLTGMIHNSHHGKHLKTIGFKDDLEACVSVDVYQLVPIFKNGTIITLHNVTG